MLNFISQQKYISRGLVENTYWIKGAGNNQEEIIKKIFGAKVKSCYTEVLFDLGFGRMFLCSQSSFLGRLDSKLSNNLSFLSWFARQCSFHVAKEFNKLDFI